MGRLTSAISPPIQWHRAAGQRRPAIARDRQIRRMARLAPSLIRDRFSSRCVLLGKTQGGTGECRLRLKLQTISLRVVALTRAEFWRAVEDSEAAASELGGRAPRRSAAKC